MSPLANITGRAGTAPDRMADCQPREEHLLPLHVCAGMAKKSATLIFDDDILGKRAVAFLW
jgi:hypothetical protein